MGIIHKALFVDKISTANVDEWFPIVHCGHDCPIPGLGHDDIDMLGDLRKGKCEVFEAMHACLGWKTR
jgi:hypothetical protein